MKQHSPGIGYLGKWGGRGPTRLTHMENVKWGGEGSKSIHGFRRHLDLFLEKEEIDVHVNKP